MGVVNSISTDNKQFWIALSIAGLIAGLIIRIQLATVAQMPGHGDSAFYYTVAKNIVDGRGVVVDYIVYYFNGLIPITHYAGDFWNPLAEILLSLPMFIFGKSVFNALLASITAGVVPAIVGLYAAKKYNNSIAFAVLAGILTFFSPFEVWTSSLTEAIIFAGAFGSLAIYFAIKGQENPRYFLISAICTGLTHFIRQDGVLLLVTLILCILIAPIEPKKKLLTALAAIGIHSLVLSPLLIRNYIEFHALFPSGPAQTMFLTAYEDFHSYGKELDWKTLRATWGILGIIKSRLHTAVENINQVKYFLDPLLFYLTTIGIVNLLIVRRKSRKLLFFLPVLIFISLEYLFYTLIASFSGPGSLPKILAIALPFICIVIVDLFDCYMHPKALLAVIILILAAYSGYRGFQGNYQSTVYYNEIYNQYKTMKSFIIKDSSTQGISINDVVVMTRNPWDIYEGTGFKAVMIPNNDLETIYYVAKHYGAGYILLPAPRKSLESIYNGEVVDPRFTLVAQVPDSEFKIYRINFTP